MVIIVFIGPPGSGKTTQIHLFSKVLNSRGKKVSVLCLKRGFFATFLERVLVLLIYGKNPHHLYPMETLLRGAKDKLKKIVSLWYTINTLEIVIRLLVLMVASKVFKRIFLVEEYIPAIIADYIYIMLRLQKSITIITRDINILIHLYLKVYPLKLVVLTASLKELIYRWYKRGRAEPSRIYVFVQRVIPNLIKMLARHPNKDILIIDTTYKPIYKTQKILVQNIHV